MSCQIDELLKQSEYNIYNNPKVSDEKIAKVISDDKKQIKEKVKIASNKMRTEEANKRKSESCFKVNWCRRSKLDNFKNLLQKNRSMRRNMKDLLSNMLIPEQQIYMKIKFALKYIMGQEAKSEKSRKCV